MLLDDVEREVVAGEGDPKIGAPLLGHHTAKHVLESITLLGPTALFAAFTGVDYEEITFEGAYTRVTKARLGFTPYQTPHPPLEMGAQSDGATRRAARLTDGVFFGPVLAEMAMLAGYVGVEKLKPRDSSSAHLIAEIEKRAFRDRNRYLGDPAFGGVRQTLFTDPVRIRKLAATIDPAHATPTDKLRPAEPDRPNTTQTASWTSRLTELTQEPGDSKPSSDTRKRMSLTTERASPSEAHLPACSSTARWRTISHAPCPAPSSSSAARSRSRSRWTGR